MLRQQRHLVALLAVIIGLILIGHQVAASPALSPSPTFVVAGVPTAGAPTLPIAAVAAAASVRSAKTATARAAVASKPSATSSSVLGHLPQAPSAPVASQPIPIVGQIPLLRPQDQLIFDGQSFNYAPWEGTKRTYPVQLLDLLGIRVGASATVATSGTTYAQRAPSVATRVDPLYARAHRTTVLDLAGESDLVADMPAKQLFDTVAAYADARRAAGATFVIEFTITPSTWYSPAQEVQRRSYNTLLRTNAGKHITAVVDLASRPEFADATDTRYFSDGLHPTEESATIIANLARDAVRALIG